MQTLTVETLTAEQFQSML